MARTKLFLFNQPSRSTINRVLIEHTDALEKLDGGNEAFATTIKRIYARTTGSDSTGDGLTTGTAFRTFQKAVRSVPLVVPPGFQYVIDITGLGTETLPINYTLPAWKSADIYNTFTDQIWVARSGVTIEATPQLVASISAADATLASGSDFTATTNAGSGLVTLTLTGAPRASWASNALKGKFVIGATGGIENAVIVASDTTYIRLTTTTALTTPMQIMEPTATLSGTNSGTFRGSVNAINVDSLTFNGIKIVNTGGASSVGLFVQGYGQTATNLCELQGPSFCTMGTFINRIQRSWLYGAPIFWGRYTVTQCLMDQLTATPFRGPATPQYRRTAFNACTTLDVSDQIVQSGIIPSAVPLLLMENIEIVGSAGATSDGLRLHGTRAILSNVDVSACGRDGIRCEAGDGYVELNNVRTTGTANGVTATGYGINVQDGMRVKVNSSTYNATTDRLQGGGGDMKVGANATRTFANFVSGADSRPVKNESDLTADLVSGIVSGTGSMVYGV